jgi:hypothetical protein
MSPCRHTAVLRAGCALAVGVMVFAASPGRAAERTFFLPDASTRFDVELTTASCEGDSCTGPLQVVLYRKGTKRKVRSFSEKECVVRLTEQGVPYVSVAQLYEVDAAIVFDDLDFDGEEDFAIRRETGAGYMGLAYTVYLWNPAAERLEKSGDLSRLVGKGALGFFRVDTDRQRLVTFFKDGCCFHRTTEYAFVHGEVYLARTITDDNGDEWTEDHPLGSDLEKPGPPEAMELVKRWLDAQNRGKLADYQACYAKTLTGIRRSGQQTKEMDCAAWMADRQAMFARPMQVELRFAVASYDSTGVKVRGTQIWASGKYKDRGLKVLHLVREDGQWKIDREELLASQIIPVAKP